LGGVSPVIIGCVVFVRPGGLLQNPETAPREHNIWPRTRAPHPHVVAKLTFGAILQQPPGPDETSTLENLAAREPH
jgi:hypothetical protein